jgi:hypothetical protein
VILAIILICGLGAILAPLAYLWAEPKDKQ